MNIQPMNMSFNPSIEQLEEQIIRHQKQIRALHFEIAKRQMQQAAQPTQMNTDSFQGNSQGFKSPIQVNPFDQPANSFGQQSGGANAFGQSFGQQTPVQTPTNSFGQQSSTQNAFGQLPTTQNAFGQQPSTQNAFGQNSPGQNAFDQNQNQSNMAFGQKNAFESNSNANSQPKRSFGHPSQSSLGPDISQQQPKAFERPQTAPAQSSELKPNGRMINKNGQFLGRVQAMPTEGFAVSIKRLGKPKFFDYKTVAECLREWSNA